MCGEDGAEVRRRHFVGGFSPADLVQEDEQVIQEEVVYLGDQLEEKLDGRHLLLYCSLLVFFRHVLTV